MHAGKGRMRGGIAALACLALVACGSADSPETQVRAVLEAAESAAEARDVSGLADLVSPDFRDTDGRTADDLTRYLRGFFIANQSIHLLTRVESIEFPVEQVAEVRLAVAMVGREAEAQSAWDLAADLYEIELTLMNEDGDWRITHADARPSGR